MTTTRKFSHAEAGVIFTLSKRGVACATLTDARKLLADGFVAKLDKRSGASHQFRLTAEGKELAKRVAFGDRGILFIRDAE